MARTDSIRTRFYATTIAIMALGCNFLSAVAPPGQQTSAPPPSTPALPEAAATQQTAEVPPTVTATVTHLTSPAASVPAGKLIYDVISEDTAPEKRAPYGDSYDINRLERPFQQDMTYVPDLDIATFAVSSDQDWWYVSIQLVGVDPNNPIGINFGVELDTDHDGFGDFLILAHGPLSSDWETNNVEIYKDSNHDTGGLSAEKSDAPFTADGYDTRIFHGGAGDADPDVAWARYLGGAGATVQFAFKKTWSGTVFMLGVLADAGLKDPTQLDYVDRFKAEDAGSPVRDNKYYPIKDLFLVDNVCRAPFGFKSNGYEPQLCPSTEPPATKRPKATGEPTVEPTQQTIP